jgi:hypothetical protein
MSFLARRRRDRNLLQYLKIGLERLIAGGSFVELENIRDDVEVNLIAETAFLFGRHRIAYKLEFFTDRFSNPRKFE